MRKQIQVITTTFCKFEELTPERQKQEIEKWIEAMTKNGLYYDWYIEPNYEDDIERLQEESGIKFEIVYECGSSYIYIKDIKIGNLSKQLKSGDWLEIEIEYTHPRYRYESNKLQANVLTDYEESDNDEINEILKDYQCKLDSLYDGIMKIYKTYEYGLLYGCDDYAEDNAREDMISNDNEFEVTTTTLLQADIIE